MNIRMTTFVRFHKNMDIIDISMLRQYSCTFINAIKYKNDAIADI